MKKIVKIILALALAAATAFSLTSCLALDRAKERHIKYVEDKNDEVTFNGKTYKRLPKTSYAFSSSLLTLDEDYRITEPDVPVLLSNMYGFYASYDEERDLICSTVTRESASEESDPFFSGFFNYGREFNEYYTTEEHYEEYSAMIEHPDFTSFALKQNVYDDDDFYRVKDEKIVVIPEKVMSLLLDDMNDKERAVTDEDTADYIVSEGYIAATLYSSTSDGLVINFGSEIDVIAHKDNHYLRYGVYDGDYSLVRLSEDADKAMSPYYDEMSTYYGYDYYDGYYD